MLPRATDSLGLFPTQSSHPLATTAPIPSTFQISYSKPTQKTIPELPPEFDSPGFVKTVATDPGRAHPPPPGRRPNGSPGPRPTAPAILAPG